jgi:putative DNA methylase
MTYKKKLIEVALPLVAISDASAYEQSVKRGKPSQLHKWWARRPSVAARAILWASLVDDPSAHPERFPDTESQRSERSRLFRVLEGILEWDLPFHDPRMRDARAELGASLDGDGPIILDPFGGGGTIALEAQRLGLRTATGDLNPVAVLIQRGLLELPARFSNGRPVHPSGANRLNWTAAQGLAHDVEAYGSELLGLATQKLAPFYPKEPNPTTGNAATVTHCVWARTVKSPDPSFPFHVPLVGSWVLATKNAVQTWIEPIVDRSSGRFEYRVREGGTPPPGTVGARAATCLATGSPITLDYIKAEGEAGRIGNCLIALVAEGDRSKVFLQASDLQLQAARDCPEPQWRPEGLLSTHPQYMGTPRYGLDEWWKLFTPRQLLALTTFSDLLPSVRQRVLEDSIEAGMANDSIPARLGGDGSTAYADAVVTYLAFAIDRLADWNSNLCRWEKKAAVSQQVFSDKAIKMVWDYAEANPLAASTGSLRATLKTIRGALEAIPSQTTSAQVAQRDAESYVEEVGLSCLSTDPPYYAQVPYSDISDFFYVWLRHNLRDIWPDECATLVTPKSDELVADEKRHGSKDKAARFFEEGIERVFRVVARNQDERFPATIFYAFKASDVGSESGPSTGWETFIHGLLEAGLAISATWPVRTENKSRMRALGSNVLASSVVLVCRPRSVTAVRGTRSEFLSALRAEMPASVHMLQDQAIAPVDLAQAAIGPGVSVFSRFQSVVEVSGDPMSVKTALALINEVLGEVLSGEEAEFDSPTRFALTWFEQYGHGSGPFGDADLLARAKNTTVQRVIDAGLATSRDGMFQLLGRRLLPEGWDPLTDRTPTVWEACQYLIRALESSESEAALLLRAMGGGAAERARQLAYLLFDTAGRRKLADEAVAYNMLVTAWPELARLAARNATSDDRLFS